MDTDGSSGAALARRKRCAVHGSSMFRPCFVHGLYSHNHDRPLSPKMAISGFLTDKMDVLQHTFAGAQS